MRRLWKNLVLKLLVAVAACCLTFAQTQVQVGYTTLVPDTGTAAPVGTALFSYTNAGGILVSQAGVGASEPIRSGRIFVDEAGTQTGIALVNSSGSDASVTLTLRDASGNELGRRSVPLGAHQHSARYVSELFADRPANLTGSLTFESDQALASIALRESRNAQSEPLYATLPVVDLNTVLGN